MNKPSDIKREKGNIIITAGDKYTDIDVLACVVAYHELLKLQGKRSLAVLPGPLNETVTKTVRTWEMGFVTQYEPGSADSFVIMDLSTPEFISKIVDQERIIKIFDHHPGYEEYWKSEIGGNSIIEPIGACATLILGGLQRVRLRGSDFCWFSQPVIYCDFF